jgi:Gas vesicle synthesis protein GvpL/GvpF
MSEVYVHGVVKASERVDVEAAPTRWIAHHDVAALASDADESSRIASKALRRHWRVLEEVAVTTTILPVRFGTAMTGDEAVIGEFLAPSYESLAASLENMAGKVQLTVKGVYEEGALLRGVVERTPAIARLRERVKRIPEAAGYYDRIRLGEMIAAAVEQARGADTARVLERLSPLAVATSREAPSSVNSAIDAAFLVERARIEEFSRGVAEVGRELGQRVRLRYVGPLPPYSFAQEAIVARGEAWA